MARRSKTPPPVVGAYSTLHAIRGAAERIDLEAQRTKQTARRQEAWQEKAWELFGQVGEMRQAARIFGDAFARTRWFVGVRPDPESDPVQVDEENATELGVSLADAAVAEDALTRLRSPHGGATELRRSLGIQLFVPGECYLVGRPDPTVDEGERWDIYSTAQFEPDPTNHRFVLKTSRTVGQGGIDLPEESTTAARIYRPHPQYDFDPDSPIRSSLTILEEYLDLTDAIRASARSRTYGPGVWVWPRSALGQANTGDTAGQGDGQSVGNNPIITDLIEASGLAMTDLASPFSRVPLIIGVEDSLWREKDWSTTLIQWDREVDKVAADQRAELIKRFAVSIDLPAEYLTGVADLNHWSAWSVPESAFRDHIAPALIIGVDGVTIGYLKPALELAGVDPSRWEVWFDPAPLITNVNRTEDYKFAYDNLEVSGDALRRELDIAEEDAPDAEEVARRIVIERARAGTTGQTPAAGPRALLPGPPDEDGPVEPEPPPMAGSADPLAAVPGMLAAMDDAMFADLHQRADAAMRRALERANGRLRRLAVTAEGNRLGARAAVEGVQASSLMVAPTLGPTLTAALIGDEDVFAGTFDDLAERFTTRTVRAAREVVQMARAVGDISDLDANALLARLEDESREGAGLLLAALTALASRLLARPEPQAQPPGETDGALVAPELVRNALIRAGGGGASATSMLTGDLIRDLWSRAGIRFEGRVWRYGDPAARESSFEPHRRLDGTRFDDFDDPVLATSGGWPFVDHYRPRDHPGCLCNAPFRVAQRDETGRTIPGEEEAA